MAENGLADNEILMDPSRELIHEPSLHLSLQVLMV